MKNTSCAIFLAVSLWVEEKGGVMRDKEATSPVPFVSLRSQNERMG